MIKWLHSCILWYLGSYLNTDIIIRREIIDCDSQEVHVTNITSPILEKTMVAQ